MKKIILTAFMVLLTMGMVKATDYYVAKTGSDSNTGTSLDSPLANVTTAISKAVAGDVIYIREGEYKYSTKISLSRSGTAANPIQMMAYQNEKVIIDFSQMALDSGNRGFSLSGQYWIIKGLTIRRAGDNGMFISGSYNTVENCIFYEHQDTGLQLGNGASENNIINCDSYGNADPTDYGDADGFACKMDVGNNNYFYGCRSWLNVDDGWDGYLRGTDDVYTVLENCWTWRNGYFLNGTDAGASANGNGFKVGGSDDKTLMHNFTLINCVAFDNKAKGFDQNNNKGDMYFYNGTSYRNKGNNYSIPSAVNSAKEAEVVNCISVEGSNKVSLTSSVLQQTNSWNGFTCNSADFVSLDTTGVTGPRQADGSLPDLDVFKLVQGSDLIDGGTDLGYDFYDDAPDLGAFETNYNQTGIFSPVNEIDYELFLHGNPVTSKVRFSYQAGELPLKVTVNVVSLNGSVIESVNLPAKASRCYGEVDINACSNGMYILQLVSSKGMQSKLFVKQ
ncbi:right-handed parallel beta-helix repeat-containing protein [Carboxylicivirga caseinilyticus]|uniref:right-handed parallel beta-helix repeat-containing protein n=1 Tax=Carboxylicivirga caseinilyticus TaxID=3417572 RepID=UPI003D324DE8|nr:right-handed parallel beta-helix repeat-containing protein [Marinilabiliaceae bacterium A049]